MLFVWIQKMSSAVFNRVVTRVQIAKKKEVSQADATAVGEPLSLLPLTHARRRHTNALTDGQKVKL